MARSDTLTPADAVARFQAEVHRLAFSIAHAVIEQELDRKRAALADKQEGMPRPRSKLPQVRRESAQGKRKQAQPPPAQLELLFAPAPDTPTEPTEPPAAPLEAAAAPARSDAPISATPQTPERPEAPETRETRDRSVPAAGARRRTAWTREHIVEELANWLMSGTKIDAPFLTRHGPAGLVAATRRVFGRFDAALNVAALHLSQLYPDGPPARRPS
jgi:hypothetical protein